MASSSCLYVGQGSPVEAFTAKASSELNRGPNCAPKITNFHFEGLLDPVQLKLSTLGSRLSSGFVRERSGAYERTKRTLM